MVCQRAFSHLRIRERQSRIKSKIQATTGDEAVRDAPTAQRPGPIGGNISWKSLGPISEERAGRSSSDEDACKMGGQGKTQQTPRVSRQIWTGNVRRRRAPVGNKGPGGTSWPDGRIPRSLSIVRLSPSQRDTPGDGLTLFFLCRAAAGSERAGVGMDVCPLRKLQHASVEEICSGQGARGRGNWEAARGYKLQLFVSPT